MSLRYAISIALLSLALTFHAPTASLAKDPVYTGTLSSLAVSGYDPVAYFTDGKPVEGESAFEYEWNGATWRSDREDTLYAYKKNPEAKAPHL